MTTTLIMTDPKNDHCPAWLPEEIAKLLGIPRNCQRDFLVCPVVGWSTAAAAALEQQARKIERLIKHCQTANADREHDAAEIEKLETRIGELEATKAKMIEIMEQIYKLLDGDGAPPDLLSIIGSYGDTLDDSEVLRLLREWNDTGKVIHERQ